MGRQVRRSKTKVIMAEWIKWWNDKTIVTIMVVAISSVGLAALSAVLIDWGWVISIIIALVGGYTMKRILFKRLDEIAAEKEKELLK